VERLNPLKGWLSTSSNGSDVVISVNFFAARLVSMNPRQLSPIQDRSDLLAATFCNQQESILNVRLSRHAARTQLSRDQFGTPVSQPMVRRATVQKPTNKLLYLGVASALGLFSLVSALGATPDCLSCHSPGTGLRSSQGKAITVDPTALAKSVHAGFQCVDCHAGAAKLPHKAKTAAASCQTCHGNIPQVLKTSAHAMLGDPNDPQTCIACHGAHDVAKTPTLGSQFCAPCHSTEVSQYDKSIHGRARAHGNRDAADCQSCHGPAHQVLMADNPKSPVNKVNVPDTCGTCHSNPRLVAKYYFAVAFPVKAYKAGVHGRAIEHGNLKAAACYDCHGVHDILPADDPHSTIWKQNVATTCGKCHIDVYNVYRGSVHGQSVAAGVLQAATCTDCHGEHRILAPGNPQSPVYVANVSQDTCSRCHGNTELMASFNLPLNRVPTYEDSYHGLAAREGQETVANCASCHGVHNIYRPDDPRSTVNKANLGKTCGKCHSDAGQRFAIGLVHVLPASTTGGRVLAVVKAFYLFAIPLVLGCMFFHNLLDWWRKARRTLAQNRAGHGQIRMTLNERAQHFLLLGSFIMLVVTGFALKYPGAFWAAPIVRWEGHFPLRALLHRICGVVLISASLYHVVYLIRSREGRRWFKGMLPKARDVREAVGTVGHNLGYRKSLPRYSRFNYIEKAEYWALVWGTVVMAITGILLWSHNWILSHLPFPMDILDVTTAIHFYEAILATFAILLWHFYAVIFDPDVYPLKWTFLTGRSPEHEVREESEQSQAPAPVVPRKETKPPEGKEQLPATEEAKSAPETEKDKKKREVPRDGGDKGGS
jgi:formate dehydrogenase gamma subunit